MSVIDCRYYYVDKSALFILGLLGVWHGYIFGYEWTCMVFSATLTAGTVWLVTRGVSWWRQKPVLGRGDIWFLGCAGLYLPPETLPAFGGYAGLLSLLFGGLIPKNHEGAFPLIPPLALVLWLFVLYHAGYNRMI